MLIILVTGVNNTSNVSQGNNCTLNVSQGNNCTFNVSQGNNCTLNVSQCNNCQLSPSEAIHQRNKVYCIAIITLRNIRSVVHTCNKYNQHQLYIKDKF